jgi:hypothetical protein
MSILELHTGNDGLQPCHRCEDRQARRRRRLDAMLNMLQSLVIFAVDAEPIPRSVLGFLAASLRAFCGDVAPIQGQHQAIR